MDMKKLIERINFLYSKSQNEGLNDEEKLEQKKLRQQYIEIFKNNFRAQLEGIERVPSKNIKMN
ncbi:DUF896 domain-containing protein [Clostridium sp. DJ247]|uniref:DUF896 domain-containing protein n=1 Tax=Clostridium sp. DJ247 TaxID=2726188 RepID=UPI0016261579|nr:DUF896 domain-containing protein [Clostridium sp. DJ247]MBC2582548.1 DUF896 domain-containing protein [Clostridium sp. DJ247]